MAFGKQKPCFGDKKDPQNPFSRNEKEFIEFIKLNTKQTRAEINCGSGAIYIGKNLQNNWEELFGSSAGVPSIIVEECALDEIVDIKNPTIVDDNYWGGKGTEQYKNATADVVKLCRDFVAKNSL